MPSRQAGQATPREQQRHDRGGACGQDRDVSTQAGIAARRAWPARSASAASRDRHTAGHDRSGGAPQRPPPTRPAASSWPRVIPSAARVALSGDAASSSRDGYLADDQQRGDRENQREQGQRHRLGADRSLDGGRLRGLVGDEHLAPGTRETGA